MGRRVVWILVAAGVLASVTGAWVTGRARMESARTAPAGSVASRSPGADSRPFPSQQAREALFAEVQPVKLTNCELARYGEKHDGGYLACRNLLPEVRAAYSYGISGYDGWGCEISTELKVPVHQYDCFDTRHPSCPGGQTIFHPECVGGSSSTDAGGRVFDSIQGQITRNGDSDKHLVMKMDVEGAEWESLLSTPDAVFEKIDQLILEFHGVDKNIERSREVVLKLKEFFHVAHFHVNNYSCRWGLQPFGGWAYEVTFVSKRLAKLDLGGGLATLPNPLDTPNNPAAPDCQVPPRALR